MLDFPRWKIWSIWLVILAGIAFAVPSVFPKAQVATWPKFAPRAQINLGLDLAGGSQLLLEADERDGERDQPYFPAREIEHQSLAGFEEPVATPVMVDLTTRILTP